MNMHQGLPPVFGTDPRVMILGSFPSPLSLNAGEYYGNPKNRFWEIMECLLGIPGSLPYEERISRIGSAGIVLWDVIGSCERDGALDSRIRNAHVNDIPAVLDRYKSIGTIGLNGSTAGRYLRKTWPAGFQGITIVILPSTSPANARMRFSEKVSAWHRITEGIHPLLSSPQGTYNETYE
ncbi:MAG TPA: DNA-deoxyinosine glycosylase [Methanoregulaceae archaeon]|nr:DNA-deoxyinosine glycosylase [Methanoregulaceae archaeon]HVP94667.1 DNA-deoxyinosine glycosylase [Methanoregulaceae archaeon]